MSIRIAFSCLLTLLSTATATAQVKTHEGLQLFYEDTTDLGPYSLREYWDKNDAYLMLSGKDEDGKVFAKLLHLQQPGATFFSNNKRIEGDNDPNTHLSNAEVFWAHDSKTIRITDWDPMQTRIVDFKTAESVAPSIPSRMLVFSPDRSKYIDRDGVLHRQNGEEIRKLPKGNSYSYSFSNDSRYFWDKCDVYDANTGAFLETQTSIPGALSTKPQCNYLEHGNLMLVQDCFKVIRDDDFFGWEYCIEKQIRIYDLDTKKYLTDNLLAEGSYLNLHLSFSRFEMIDFKQGLARLSFEHGPMQSITLDLKKKRAFTDESQRFISNDGQFVGGLNIKTRNLEIHNAITGKLEWSAPGYENSLGHDSERYLRFFGQGDSTYATISPENIRDREISIIRIHDKKEVRGVFSGASVAGDNYIAIPNTSLFFYSNLREGYYLNNFDSMHTELIGKVRIWVHPKGRYVVMYNPESKKLQVYQVANTNATK